MDIVKLILVAVPVLWLFVRVIRHIMPPGGSKMICPECGHTCYMVGRKVLFPDEKVSCPKCGAPLDIPRIDNF